MAQPESDMNRVLNPQYPSQRAKLEALRAAINEGDTSGIAEGDTFAWVRRRLGLGGVERAPES